MSKINFKKYYIKFYNKSNFLWKFLTFAPKDLALELSFFMVWEKTSPTLLLCQYIGVLTLVNYCSTPTVNPAD